MKQQPQDRVAIYSRKSKFTGKGESIGNQVELCRAHIGGLWGESCAHGALVFEDEGFSGGNLNRPAFQRMMACAQAGQFRAIVVYRLDRISRSIGDFAALIQELDRLGVAFLSIREQFDTDSPMGRAMMYIASVFSQLERETIAERIRDNLRELAKTGRWLGGVTPTGFASESVKTVTLDGKSKKACKLKLIPAEAETVRHIFNLYLETGSLARTEEKLGALPTKTGRRFTRFSIRAILQNPVYLTADEAARDYFLQRQVEVFPDSSAFDGVHGILAYRRTRQEKGKSTVSLPVQEWIISVGQHPGIIPARDWIAVQEMLERNRSGSYHTPRKNEALLTGLLFCRCGGKMYPKAKSKSAAAAACAAVPTPAGRRWMRPFWHSWPPCRRTGKRSSGCCLRGRQMPDTRNSHISPRHKEKPAAGSPPWWTLWRIWETDLPEPMPPPALRSCTGPLKLSPPAFAFWSNRLSPFKIFRLYRIA